MKTVQRFFVGFLLSVLFIVPQVAIGASDQQVADPVLRQLYLEQLQSTTGSAGLDARIVKERLRVRAEEVRALEALVNDASIVSEAENATTTTTVLQKQQALVDVLLARRQEAKVDHDLLQEEEGILDQQAETAKGSALTGVLRRKADLLSRRAVFEERLLAIDDALVQQQDRLQRLVNQDRLQQFAGVLHFLFYVGIFLLIVTSERFARRRLIVRIRDRNRRYLVAKLFTGAVYVVVITWMIYRLSGDYPGFFTSFAIVGAGIAVALQTVIKDVVGWLIIVQKRLFTLGQRVTIGSYTGDVADISLLRTTLVEVVNAQSPDVGRMGQTLHVPNALVLDQPVLNYHATSDFMEAEILVTVTYDSDWKEAEVVLRQILQDEVGQYVPRARLQHALRTAHFFASQEPPEPRVFVELVADGVLFTLRFQIPIGSRRGIVSNITRNILNRFAAAKIGLAYKTVTVVQGK